MVKVTKISSKYLMVVSLIEHTNGFHLMVDIWIGKRIAFRKGGRFVNNREILG